MSEWNGTGRTNYFRVKDEEAFTKFVASAEGCVIIRDKEGRFGITTQNTAHGAWPSIPDERDGTEDQSDTDFVDCLVPYLAEGEVAVIMEAGAEKHCYITGKAIAVTWDGRRTGFDLENIYWHAERAFGVTPTKANY